MSVRVLIIATCYVEAVRWVHANGIPYGCWTRVRNLHNLVGLRSDNVVIVNLASRAEADLDEDTRNQLRRLRSEGAVEWWPKEGP